MVATVIALISAGLFASSAATLWWMLHAWRTPEVLRATRFEPPDGAPALSFSLLVPARHEELVLEHTVTRLLEMETLSIGIEGKLALWLTLKEIAGVDARLAGTDFDRLVERARLQRQKLEPHRLEAATKAFTP